MSTAATEPNEFVVLHGVPWEVYTKVTDALGDCHLRHTYDHGTLEMRAVVNGLPWDGYERFLDAIGDSSLRHTYDRGTLEMMSPLKEHDWLKKLLGRLIEAVSLELDIPVQSVGSMTIRKAIKSRGLQPDESYYIANELKVRGNKHYDPKVDPPPDLVIEADVTNSSIDRLPIFAEIGVPEIWHLSGKQLRFLKRKSTSEYGAIRRSIAFPLLTPQIVMSFLERAETINETALIRDFMTWVRENMK
jgi:Uma2 family endonuclease